MRSELASGVGSPVLPKCLKELVVWSCVLVSLVETEYKSPQAKVWGSQCTLSTRLTPALVNRCSPGERAPRQVVLDECDSQESSGGLVNLCSSCEGHQDSVCLYGIWDAVYALSVPGSLVARRGSCQEGVREVWAFGRSSRHS